MSTNQPPKKLSPGNLRTLSLFEGLSDEQLIWIANHTTALELEPNDMLLEKGQTADAMFVLVEGALQFLLDVGGQLLPIAIPHPGTATGLLPYSRMVQYPGSALATVPTRVLRVGKE